MINYFPAGTALECVSCHSPHGSANFRNLIPYQLRSTAGYSSVMAPSVAKAAAFDSKGGSIWPMLVSGCEADLTRQRTQQLVEMIEGEGQ